MGAARRDVLGGQSRWSKPMEALIASMMASGPEAKRPPHIALASISSLMSSCFRKGFALVLRALTLFLVYTAVSATANPAAAQALDAAARARLEALREGDMRKLAVHEAPAPAPDVADLAADGTRRRWPRPTAGCGW